MNNISFGKKYNIEQQEQYLQKAKELAQKSICERAKVGAVIVAQNDEIIGEGFNAVPEGLKSCKALGGCPRRTLSKIIPNISYQHSCQAIHAEQNALLSAGYKNAEGATLFLYGIKDICTNCQRLLIQAKINDFYIKPNETSKIRYLNIKDVIKITNRFFERKIRFLHPIKFLKN